MILAATKTWQGDVHKIVNQELFFDKFEGIAQEHECHLFINNVDNPEEVFEEASKRGMAPHMAQEAPWGNDVYGNAEWEACLMAMNGFEYLLWYSSDALSRDNSWVTDAIKMMEEKPYLLCVSPLSEVNTWHDVNCEDDFFSDQAFLMRVHNFREHIFLPGYIMQVDSELPQYPAHGKESFEKRMARAMRKDAMRRGILTQHWYDHPAW